MENKYAELYGFKFFKVKKWLIHTWILTNAKNLMLPFDFQSIRILNSIRFIKPMIYLYVNFFDVLCWIKSTGKILFLSVILKKLIALYSKKITHEWHNPITDYSGEQGCTRVYFYSFLPFGENVWDFFVCIWPTWMHTSQFFWSHKLFMPSSSFIICIYLLYIALWLCSSYIS